MHPVCLLTGSPGVGKTSLIIEATTSAARKTGGFYTREIREHGRRVGFEIVTLGGERGMLAHVNLRGLHRVGKYVVDVDNIDKVGVSALNKAVQENEVVVVDEIGRMELFSTAFQQTVLDVLDSGKYVLGTIMRTSHPWADRIKQRPEVQIIELTRGNWNKVLERVVGWLGGGILG